MVAGGYPNLFVCLYVTIQLKDLYGHKQTSRQTLRIFQKQYFQMYTVCNMYVDNKVYDNSHVDHVHRLLFSPRTHGHCPQEIYISDRKYLRTFLKLIIISNNNNIFILSSHLQAVNCDISTLKGLILVPVMLKMSISFTGNMSLCL